MEVINLEEKFDKVNEFWSPKILGKLNGQLVKIAKFKGEFVRHRHQDEDELFLVISGSMEIEFDDKTVSLSEGEMIIAPKGVYHKPIAKEECHCLLLEPESTLNTGDAESKLKKKILEWI